MVSGSAKTKMLLALLGCSSGASVFSPELSELPVLAAMYYLPPTGAARQSHAACVEKQ
jgi:hypothetical protein